MKIGDKIWVNKAGPCILWNRSDLVVKRVLNETVEVCAARDLGRSVKYTYRLLINQVEKQ